jgi:hypothetical protein
MINLYYIAEKVIVLAIVFGGVGLLGLMFLTASKIFMDVPKWISMMAAGMLLGGISALLLSGLFFHE